MFSVRSLSQRVASSTAAALLCLVAISCGGSGGGDTTGPTPVATVELSPPANTLLVAQTVQLAPTTKDAGGNILAGRTVTWSSSATNIASVSSSGVVTGVALGTATIFATSEGKSGTASITVHQIPVNALVLTPPTAGILVGATVQLTATTTDTAGNTLTGRTIAWVSGTPSVASISNTGLVTAIAVGTTNIRATSEGKADTTQITVTQVPVNALVLTPPTSSMLIGATVQLSATTTDAGGQTLTGRTIAWVSGTPATATVSNSGLVTAVAVGTTNITATSEGKADTTAITVTLCSGTLNLALGEIHTLTSTERASLCINGGASASEYAIVPFNNSTVAASTTPVTLTATNTSAVSGPLASLQPPMGGALGNSRSLALSASLEASFRARERREVGGMLPRARSAAAASTHGPLHPYLTGISATPTVGSIVQINASLSGSLCAAKTLRAARVVTVLPHTIVLFDTLSPAGGYTDVQMTAFGQSFDTLGYVLDTTNFGVPSDIDGNGRVAILFTPGVNAIPGPPGGYVLGLQTTRDLVPVSSCAGSNEGEMFYIPVPDPSSTINGNYTNTASLSNTVLSTLVHEFQHLINAGRRIYVNNAPALEEVWLNEGLSHISEELLYYRVSGNATKANIGLSVLQSSQPQLDAFNLNEIQNFLRLRSYMISPEINSPYSQIDNLEMRGAIWQLLRYSQDRKGGTERSTWYPLVNTTSSGQTNFNAVFGNITTMAHDWSIAQLTDDAGLSAAASFTNPSWNFRNVMPALNSGAFPLLTHPLLSSPVSVSLNGGGAAYVRFRVAANVVANVLPKSSGVAVPANVDLTLVRTQ
jgi:uncharacterized protein YjdB